MLQILGLGMPFFEIVMRFLIWLYLLPLTFALIALGFVKESFLTLFKFSVPLKQRLTEIRYLAIQSVIGGFVTVVTFVLIYYRSDILKCVIRLF